MDYEKDERHMPDKPKTDICESCKFDKHCSFQGQVPKGMAITRCELKEAK